MIHYVSKRKKFHQHEAFTLGIQDFVLYHAQDNPFRTDTLAHRQYIHGWRFAEWDNQTGDYDRADREIQENRQSAGIKRRVVNDYVAYCITCGVSLHKPPPKKTALEHARAHDHVVQIITTKTEVWIPFAAPRPRLPSGREPFEENDP